ncbi:MAG: hypothetical protein ACKOWG_05310, partial [Planctomycetia bacterium]
PDPANWAASLRDYRFFAVFLSGLFVAAGFEDFAEFLDSFFVVAAFALPAFARPGFVPPNT